MVGKTIIAPDYVQFDGALIFLAGPIQGTYDWQAQAISIIRQADENVNIASPRGNYGTSVEFVWEKQVNWERYHLRMAEKNGAILFWLSKETDHNCDRAYGQTSRFELAYYKARHEILKTKLVLGIEEGFTGARYARKVFQEDSPDVPVADSLRMACLKATELCKV